MLELIPTLFAQQQVKQAVVPVQPIEQSATPIQSPAPVVTPASAIAVPESTSVSIPATPTPVPVAIPSPQAITPISSTLSLPQVPQKASLPAKPVELVNSRSVEPQNKPVVADSNRKPIATDSKSQTAPLAATVQRTERSTAKSQPATVTVQSTEETTPKSQPVTASQRIERSTATSQPVTANQRTERSTPLPTPAVTRTPVATETPSVPKAETGIEIPVPKPTIQATPQTPTQEQKQRLEQRLADIVAKDREAKQIQQRDTLVARAYSFATQRRFAQARKLLQDPTIPADVRDQILSNINSLESASRTIGVTPIKEPVTKPVRPAVTAKKPSTSVKPVARAPQTTRQQAITIQVPRAIQSLPIQRRSPIATSTAPSASDAGGEYIDQLVKPPSNLQAFNRNLPQTNAKGQIVYPLPEPVPVTSGFGWRRHPVTGARRFHAGVDLGAAQGTPVIASRGGKVTVADRMGGYGLAIVTQQPNGKQDTLYAHLSQIYVRPGETIQPGTIIGRVGSTGLSTGPHLHYEARQMTNSGWTAVNPGAQLEAARSRLVQARQQEERSTRSSQGG
ncbi:putative peptidase [Leptolyngbya sp. NIES-3755]|nr:putative peptidase [Leptolyngbya sp. NIES-3755]